MIQHADLRALPLFDGLDDGQLDELLADAAEVRVEPGDEPFHEGAPADRWWVLIEGSIDLVRRIGREDVVVARLEPGRWAGGFRAWDDAGSYLATARTRVAGRLMAIRSARLADLAHLWFPFASHLVTGLYHTARSIESTARQRDGLITLGTLAAGIAHEINNPAAAAVRDVTTLERTTQTLLGSLRRLADAEITPAQFAAVDALRLAVDPRSAPVDPLDRADREQELSDRLAAAGVHGAWSVVPALADAGVDAEWCDRLAGVLGGTSVAPAVEWVASTLTVRQLIDHLAESTRRISDLVGAVRSYTQVDRASTQLIDVVDGLESTLSMLGFMVRGTVEIRRDYGTGLPRIEAYPGELNQVWTNLISNAVDALAGAGRLRLSTRSDGDAVVVEIADTGPGMPPEVAARAFEAFFTTKDVGEGTGLGLDIARRIVTERHGGTLTVERVGDLGSGRGETVFRVRLPVERA